MREVYEVNVFGVIRVARDPGAAQQTLRGLRGEMWDNHA